MKRILFLIPILFLLAACDSPWENSKTRAKADVIRINAEVQAADAAQALAHQKELDRLTEESEAMKVQDQKAAQEQWQKNLRTLIKVGTFSINVLMLAATVALSIFVVETGRAKGRYAWEREAVRANLIPLDRVTRQFPLLRHVEGTHISLTNPNDGATYLLDLAHEADRQLISAMGATQLSGVLADALTKTKDPGGLAEAFAMLNIPVTQAITPDLKVGTQIITVES